MLKQLMITKRFLFCNSLVSPAPFTFGNMSSGPANIVWIAQWYPHEGEPYAGDFIQRHAQAVAALMPITVYSCFGYDGEEKTDVQVTGNLTEVITYFKDFKTGISIADKAIYWNRWYRILKNLLLKHEKERGRPTLLHCHIILNTGWLGLWAKRKWGIPFIVTEHWAGYMKGFTNGYDAYNFWSKKKFGEIVKNAALVTGVSNALINRLRELEPAGNFVRLPNVVNEKIFYYKPLAGENSRPVFIHISTLTWQKNPAGIIEAVNIVKQSRPDVLLKIAGPVNVHFSSLIAKFGLEDNIEWIGEMPQEELVGHIRNSLALILFSQFESFGCVVIEANAAGVPAIVSNIEPLKELIVNGVNGLIVKEADSDALAGAMMQLINEEIAFNLPAISGNTLSQYSYEVVGQQIAGLYQKVLNSN